MVEISSAYIRSSSGSGLRPFHGDSGRQYHNSKTAIYLVGAIAALWVIATQNSINYASW